MPVLCFGVQGMTTTANASQQRLPMVCLGSLSADQLAIWFSLLTSFDCIESDGGRMWQVSSFVFVITVQLQLAQVCKDTKHPFKLSSSKTNVEVTTYEHQPLGSKKRSQEYSVPFIEQ